MQLSGIMKALLFAVVLLLIGAVGAQDCSINALINNLGPPNGGNLVALSLSADTSQRDVPTVTILEHNIVCLATATVRGQYRVASVVVSYNCSGIAACPSS